MKNQGALIFVVILIIAAGVLWWWQTDQADAPANEQGAMMEDKDGAMMEDDKMDGDAMMEEGQPVEDLSEYDGQYSLVSSQSELEWGASKIVGGSHEGMVAISDGALTLTDGQVSEATFTIDMTSITESEGGQQVVTHLKSDDFFNVAQYPTATIVVTNIAQVDGQYQVTGDLTIRDITNEVTFPAEITATADGQLMIEADFTIDRTDWEINFLSGSIFQQLGDNAIKDDIQFDLTAVLTPAS